MYTSHLPEGPWTDGSGGVQNPQRWWPQGLDVFWKRSSFRQRGAARMALGAGGCRVWGEESTSFHSLLQGLLLYLNP